MLIAAPTRAFADGAFAVDGDYIAAPGACKIESWISFAENRDRVAVSNPACVVPVFGRPFEFGIAAQRARADGMWSTSATFKVKTNILPVGVGRVGLAIGGGLSYDFTAGEYTGGNVNVPVSFQITEDFKINVNGGWLYDRVNDLHWATWGGGFEWNFVKPVTLIAEVYGQGGHSVVPSSVNSARAQAGLRFTPQEHFDIDVIYGRNITGEDSNWITLGLNVRFPPK